MSIIYRFGIFLYGFLLQIFQYFHPKAKLFVQGRKNIFNTIEKLNPQKNSHIWFHFASLGEFEQGKPIIEALKKREHDVKIAISFFSPSGYEIRKNTPLANIVCYLPLDSRTNARKFLNLINPSKVYFTKYEFWHFYIDEIHRHNIPLYLISGIFRPEQIFFKNYGTFFKKMLQKFTHIFVQNQQSLNLLHNIQIKRCSICGDTRFDAVKQTASVAPKIQIAHIFKNNQFCLVAGSTWKEDESLLIDFLKQNKDVKCIMAPHQIDATHLNSLKNTLESVSYCFYSNANKENITQTQVLVIDNIGMLATLYQYADITYVGGGFGSGIHNTLEAIVFGAPVIFGPKYQKFDEAKKIIAAQIGMSVHNLNTFEAAFLHFKTQQEQVKITAREFINENLGATNKILDYTY